MDDDALPLAFGNFELQARHRRLLRDGEPVVVGARAFDLLLALAARRDRVVTKSELLDLVWPGLVVEENNLQVQISALRRVLGPQAIATVPGRGYRFTAPLAGDGEDRASLKQRLVAILSADASEYSRLMAADANATVVALDAARGLFRKHIESRQGRVIDMAGDSVLAVFETASGAVSTALAVQQELDDLMRGTLEDQRMRFRIGVHLGDVIEKEDGTIYGDGVNIASRLEGQAAPGGVLVSDAVRGAVQGTVAAEFVDQGDRIVKNMTHAVRAFAVIDNGSTGASLSATPVLVDLTRPQKPSIAVLPFANMSDDAGQKFFADGVVEDIITALSRVRALFVIARNSSFVYEAKAIDVRKVGRELGVRYVLEGSVRRAANRVRITVQLIDAVAGVHLWSEKYDRHLTDLFSLQDEITRDIVGVVAPQVLDAEIRRARRKDPQSLDAWEFAVRAQWHLAQLNREDNAEALRLATRSAELDPGDTAGLNIAAFAHLYDAMFGWSSSAGASVLAANVAARKSVTLDARDEVAQTALGSTELFMGQHDAALTHLRAAVELNPNFSWAHGNLGSGLACAGHADEAVSSLKEAVRLSPIDKFSVLWITLLSFAQFLLGRYADGLDLAEQALRERTGFPAPHQVRAACLSQLGRIDEARASIGEYLQLAPNSTLGHLRAQVPLRRDADYEQYANALRQAGMPE
jgi:TolB-like protein/class 3 adenylate cyclase